MCQWIRWWQCFSWNLGSYLHTEKLLSWAKHTFLYGNVNDSPWIGWPISWTAMCAAVIEQSPHKSVRKQSVEVGVLHLTTSDHTKKHLEMKSVQSMYVTKLSDADMSWHHEACALLLEQFPTALSREKFLFRQICNLPQLPVMECYWAKQNTQHSTDKEDHPPHMIIWRGVTASHVIGPFFFDDTVNGVSYPERWRNYVVPEWSNRGIIEQVWFLKHCATAHFTLIVHEVLNEALPDWWIGRGSATSASPMSWPSHSPDLTKHDNSLWGIIKEKVAGYCCNTNTELWAAITDAFTFFNTTNAWKVSQKDMSTYQALQKMTAPMQIRWIHKMQVWWNK